MTHEHVADAEILPPLGEGAGIEVLEWREILEAIPRTVKLIGRVFMDSRAPLLPKVLAGVSILYAALPVDALPEILPIVGQLDDAIILLTALHWLMKSTDEAVLLEHWDGDPNTLRAVRNTMENFGPATINMIIGIREARRDHCFRQQGHRGV